MINYVRKGIALFNNYALARLQNKPSTAAFWYLAEPSAIQTEADLRRYQQYTQSPFYLIDYRKKLVYTLENADGIIVLPYDAPIGHAINPEAAFQYALGLHDAYHYTQNTYYLNKFWRYAEYFVAEQSVEGLWAYQFNWFESKAPWYSALAQARGASLMLRAWLLSHHAKYLHAMKQALAKFMIPIQQGGFLHEFPALGCPYFEEYPQTPTGVINGFMATLISIWELTRWTEDYQFIQLWKLGINSLEKMLPFYSTGWWSIYDCDNQSPTVNVNSPRYHLLEIHYLQILTLLSQSEKIKQEYEKRKKQYKNILYRQRALLQKAVRKILYR